MATRIVEHIYDDLTGELITGDGEQLRFTVNGADYELDLNVENAAAFRAALAPYIEAARKVRVPRGRPRGKTKLEGLNPSQNAQPKGSERLAG